MISIKNTVAVAMIAALLTGCPAYADSAESECTQKRTCAKKEKLMMVAKVAAAVVVVGGIGYCVWSYIYDVAKQKAAGLPAEGIKLDDIKAMIKKQVAEDTAGFAKTADVQTAVNGVTTRVVAVEQGVTSHATEITGLKSATKALADAPIITTPATVIDPLIVKALARTNLATDAALMPTGSEI